MRYVSTPNRNALSLIRCLKLFSIDFDLEANQQMDDEKPYSLTN
jgi:hypothetical protein